MANKQKMVTAVFRDPLDAQNAFDWLLNQGYTSSEINVMMSEHTRATRYTSTQSVSRKEETAQAGNQALEGSAIGGAVGTGLGAAIGAIAAIGTAIAIPGIGWVAGPIAAALAGGGAGAVAGGVIGGLIGLGIPESNAKAYEQALRDGGTILGVTPRRDGDASRIKDYFEDHGGANVVAC